MRNVCERKEGREETVENCHKVGLPMQPKVVASQHAPQRAICTRPDPLRHSQRAGVEEETQTQQGRQWQPEQTKEIKRETAVLNFSSTNCFTKSCISNSFRMTYQGNQNVLFWLSISLPDPAPPCRWLNTRQLKWRCCSVQFVSPLKDTCCLEAKQEFSPSTTAD